jgi:hypothetical protein
MVLMMDNKIFNFLSMLLMGKVIASQQILMEKIIPGMLFESKAIITDFGWLLRCEFYTRYVFRVKKKNWGLNFLEKLEETDKNTWNFIDSKDWIFHPTNRNS